MRWRVVGGAVAALLGCAAPARADVPAVSVSRMTQGMTNAAHTGMSLSDRELVY